MPSATGVRDEVVGQLEIDRCPADWPSWSGRAQSGQALERVRELLRHEDEGHGRIRGRPALRHASCSAAVRLSFAPLAYTVSSWFSFIRFIFSDRINSCLNFQTEPLPEMALTCSAIDSLQPIADTRPAFRRDALCMLGACLRHPVTCTIRDDALRLDPPDWPTGHAA